MDGAPDPAEVFAVADQGARSRQEDAFDVFRVQAGPPDGPTADVDWLIVADGMGGQVGGDVASREAVAAFIDAARRRLDRSLTDRMIDALANANRAISRLIEGDPALQGTGCTVAAVERSGSHFSWISVGDSPIWLLRDGDMERINADHSMAGLYAELVAKGEMTADEARERGGSNQLRSAVMGEPLSLVDQRGLGEPRRLNNGDILILASDGILTLPVDDIHRIATASAPAAETIAQALLQAVKDEDRPNQDNATILVYVHTDDGDAGQDGAEPGDGETDGETPPARRPLWRRLLGLS